MAWGVMKGDVEREQSRQKVLIAQGQYDIFRENMSPELETKRGR